MPVTVDWDNPKHIAIRYTFRGSWTWEEFHNILDESEQLWESVSHIVDVIVDVTGTDLPPGNATPHLQRLRDKYQNPYVGNTVLVGVQGTYRILANTFTQLHNQTVEGGKVFFVDTLEEARRRLDDNRDDAPELPE